VLLFKSRTNSAWLEHLSAHATSINCGFADPLSIAEVRQIANSVARWTWGRFSDGRFSQIQACRGARGGIKSGQQRSHRAESAADAVLAMISKPQGTAA
jgi:hypothetical protein